MMNKTIQATVLLGGLALFQQAQAAVLDIDQMLVSEASGGIVISGLPVAEYSTPIIPPAIIEMGTYQDLSSPIYSWSNDIDTIVVYSTGSYGMPVPTGTADDTAGSIDVDFSSFRLSANLGGGLYAFDVSLWPITTPPSPTSTYNPLDDSYQLSWVAPFTITIDGLLGPQEIAGTVSVDLVGTVSTVPVPAAVWLFGSGLLGLLGAAARRNRIA